MAVTFAAFESHVTHIGIRHETNELQVHPQTQNMGRAAGSVFAPRRTLAR